MAFLNENGLTRLWQNIVSRLGTKVDKVEGKGLSTCDFTQADRDLLDNLDIPEGVTVDSELSSTSTNAIQNKAVKIALDSKANSSDLTSHKNSTNNPHSVTKAQVGLGNVENKSSATIRGELTKANVTTALGYTPPAQDTVYDDTALSSKVTTLIGSDTSKSVRTIAGEVVADVIDSAPEALNTLDELAAALGDDPNFATTVATQIGQKASASDLTSHTSNKSNPHGVTKAQVGLGNVENKSAATIIGEITKANITALGIPAQDTTYSNATTSKAGLMSPTDKAKLDSLVTEDPVMIIRY